jgi:hypothetical protein
MAKLTERHEKLAAESKWDFSDLTAVFINCTLKRPPEVSNTRGLADLAVAIMQHNGVSVEVIRAVDHQIATGLQHLGYVIPPQADSGWLGEAGPGPSYLDPGSGGPENDFTNRNTTFLAWNLMHLARMLKDAGGIPAHGNQKSLWDAGCRFDFANPDYR